MLLKKWFNEKKDALKQQAQQLFVPESAQNVLVPFCVCDGGCPRCATKSVKKDNVASNDRCDKDNVCSQDLVLAGETSD